MDPGVVWSVEIGRGGQFTPLSGGQYHRNLQLRPQTDVRRKLYEGKTKEGSVLSKGQRIDVLIISAKSMKPDNLCKYRYQVLSKNSRYFKMIDFVYSYDYSLKINHCYRLTFKKCNQPPMINKIICEIERPVKTK